METCGFGLLMILLGYCSFRLVFGLVFWDLLGVFGVCFVNVFFCLPGFDVGCCLNSFGSVVAYWCLFFGLF